MNTATSEPIRSRRRVATGPARPQYLASAENDRMMMIVTALAGEVSALRDRLDTHEALAEQRLRPTAAAVEAHVPNPDQEARREAARLAMLRRVYRVVTEELDELRQGTRSSAPGPWSLPEG